MFPEEAAEAYGADKLKIYRSTFTPMYYSMTENKVKCSMKLICLLPEEKVSYGYTCACDHYWLTLVSLKCLSMDFWGRQTLSAL